MQPGEEAAHLGAPVGAANGHLGWPAVPGCRAGGVDGIGGWAAGRPLCAAGHLLGEQLCPPPCPRAPGLPRGHPLTHPRGRSSSELSVLPARAESWEGPSQGGVSHPQELFLNSPQLARNKQRLVSMEEPSAGLRHCAGWTRFGPQRPEGRGRLLLQGYGVSLRGCRSPCPACAPSFEGRASGGCLATPVPLLWVFGCFRAHFPCQQGRGCAQVGRGWHARPGGRPCTCTPPAQ